uniref:Uncharacterized protein n=1 Tax=Rhizophora mucronata TaxID=61149 RepID=A0A2P2PG84_RHIMU
MVAWKAGCISPHFLVLFLLSGQFRFYNDDKR